MRTELAELVKQIGAWPVARTVERTIPKIHFATGIELVKLTVGLRHIVATEATNLKIEGDAAGCHHQRPMVSNKIRGQNADQVAQEIDCPMEAFCTSLGLGRNIDVVAAEFSLTNVQAAKLPDTIGEATVGEVLALALAVGPAKFVAGPLALLIDIVVSCDLS